MMELEQLDLSCLALPTLPGGQVNLNGVPCEFLLSTTDWFSAPFGASHFNNPAANRLTLEFVVTDPILSALQKLDQQIVALAIKQKTFPEKKRC